jgi:predicted AAA+ superfamily ATPase
MKRSAVQYLESHWLNKKGALPLILRGARQVGKTWIARALGNQYGDTLEINFETDREYHLVFERHFGKPDLLVSNLEAISGKKIVPGKTLLFLDEIQECEASVKSIRYFKEQLPELKVIAAGSLLEFILKDIGFPVGRAETFFIQPLCFSEFLEASGIDSNSVDQIDDEILNQKLTDYFLVGGLPDSVLAYQVRKNPLDSIEVLKRISLAYRNDFPKYSKKIDLPILNLIYDRSPMLWGKKTKYVSLSDEYRAKDLNRGIDLLADAGLLQRCMHTSAHGVPLAAEAKHSSFKLFSNDIGIGLQQLQVNPALISFNELINKGGVLEQFVAQELKANQPLNQMPQLFYWHREQKSALSEVDFIISDFDQVIPIEVKSGKNTKSKSLSRFMEEKNSKLGVKVSIYGENTRKENVKVIHPGRLFKWLSKA